MQEPALGELLRAAARERTPARVLNAGAGEGLFAPLLRATCHPALQIEMDLSLAGARHLRASNQRYVCGSLTHVPLASGSIDLVLCSEVLEHIADDNAAVEEIARVLAAGGHLVLSVPAPPAVPDPNHVREGYAREALDGLLRAHGMEPVEWRACMRVFFRAVLRSWRPNRLPRIAIVSLAWLDRLIPIGRPMDLVVLARRR